MCRPALDEGRLTVLDNFRECLVIGDLEPVLVQDRPH